MSGFCSARFDTAFHAAAANWSAWRRDYNWEKAWQDRPLLTCEYLFSRFCNEYNLARNIPGDPTEKNAKRRREKAERRKKVVMNYLRTHPVPEVPAELDNYATKGFLTAVNSATEDLPELPVKSKDSGMNKESQKVAPSISLFSKVACFAFPARIPPIDRLNKAALENPTQYADFHQLFMERHDWLWNTVKERNINMLPPSFIAKYHYNDTELGVPNAFRMRITDNYLMLEGSKKLRKAHAK